MSGFSISVAQSPGQPAVAPGTVPQFIQFRYNGVDLGGPDATVIDFVGDGWTVTRGSGPTADVVTVSLG